MRDRFLSRRLATLALTANAIRPIPGGPTAVPVFFAGWLTSELAPHLLALTAADAAAHTARHGVKNRNDALALAATGLTVAGLVSAMRTGHRAQVEAEDALVDALGPDYHDNLENPQSAPDLATPWRDLVWPFRMRHADVQRTANIPFAEGGRRFRLDIYSHKDKPTGRPILLQVHGGGWVIGRKDQQGIPLMLRMASRGWVCAAANYPLSPKAKWPEHLIALKQSIAWLREHAEEYGADPNFIAVTGGSAGGHLAAMLALTAHDKSLQPGFEDADTSVQACIPHYGVYDIAAETGTRDVKVRIPALIKPMLMGRHAKFPEAYIAASPYARAKDPENADAPPFFVLHGSNDTLVPVPEARAFVQRLRELSKNPVAYAELKGAQHAFDIFPSIRSAHVVNAIERFLDWTVSEHRREADRESARRQA
jgi:acetyl esterase/lipase